MYSHIILILVSILSFILFFWRLIGFWVSRPVTDIFHRRCHYFHSGSKLRQETWFNAQAQCAILGGANNAKLVDIVTKQENDFVAFLGEDNRHPRWIGLHASNFNYNSSISSLESQLVFEVGYLFPGSIINEKTGTTMPAPWSYGEPNNKRNETCVSQGGRLVDSAVSWNDASCAGNDLSTRQFVCKYCSPRVCPPTTYSAGSGACNLCLTKCDAGYEIGGIPCAGGTNVPETTTCTACTTLNFKSTSNDTHLCQPCKTSCNPGYELLGLCTTTTDKTCSTCATGKFKSATDGSACQPFTTTCAAGAEISLNGTTTQDNTCSTCATGKFKSATDGTACQSFTTTCAAGAEISITGTTTQDNTCSTCATGNFKSTGPDALLCGLCPTTCGVGEYLSSTSCTASTSPVCTICGINSFKPTVGPEACTNCSCGPGMEVISSMCTAQSSSPCQNCASGFWNNKTTTNLPCEAWTSTCAAGAEITLTGTTTQDNTCSTCATGKFKSATDGSACTICSTTCSPGLELTSNCSTTSDRLCTQCNSGYYKTTTDEFLCSKCTSSCGASQTLTGSCTTTTTPTCAFPSFFNCQKSGTTSQNRSGDALLNTGLNLTLYNPVIVFIYNKMDGCCYGRINTKGNWATAQAACSTQFGGLLSTPSSYAAYAFLSLYMIKTAVNPLAVWLGGVGLHTYTGATNLIRSSSYKWRPINDASSVYNPGTSVFFFSLHLFCLHETHDLFCLHETHDLFCLHLTHGIR